MIIEKTLYLQAEFETENNNSVKVHLTSYLKPVYFLDKNYNELEVSDYFIEKFGVFTSKMISEFITDSLLNADQLLPTYTKNFNYECQIPIYNRNKENKDSDNKFYSINCKLEIKYTTMNQGKIDLEIKFYDDEKVSSEKEVKEDE